MNAETLNPDCNLKGCPYRTEIEDYISRKMAIKTLEQQPCEDRIRELIREFDNKHPALFADYMQEFNKHPISEIIEYMWDMHDLLEDIKYRLPNEYSAEMGDEE